MSAEELFHSLNPHLDRLDISALQDFYDRCSAGASTAEEASTRTLRQMKVLIRELENEVDRLLRSSPIRVPIFSSQESGVKAKDEEPASGSKRDRDPSSPVPSSPEASSPDEGNEDNNLAALEKPKTKHDSKKAKLEPLQDSVRGRPTPGTEKKETKGNPGPGGDSNSKGASRSDIKPETKAEEAEQPSRKPSGASGTRGVAKTLSKGGIRKQ